MEKVGDVINLISELLDINSYESAKQINRVFNLGVDFDEKTSSHEIDKYQKKKQLKEQFDKWVDYAYDVLTSYYKLLKRYMFNINDFEDKRLVEACQNIGRVESHIDYLLEANDREKMIFYKRYNKVVKEYERKLFGQFVGNRLWL